MSSTRQSFEFQKQVFDKYPVKNHKEESDAVIITVIKSILKVIENKKRRIKILDVGCGGRQLLESFAKVPKFDIYGVDISEKALKIAQEKGYKVFPCDVEEKKLPFGSNFFDIAVINDLLEHIINPDNLLREVYRVLEKEGKLVINVPNISHPVSWFMLIFLDLPPMQSARYKSVHVRDYTLRVLKIVLKLNGFEIKQIKGTYLYPFDNLIGRFIANLFPRLSERIIFICEKGVIHNLESADLYFDLREVLHIGEKL